ncbi:unnamed protein product [Closterium sp. NIES-54]
MLAPFCTTTGALLASSLHFPAAAILCIILPPSAIAQRFKRHNHPSVLPMASAPPLRAESWTSPLPAKPALPPSAPPPSAPPLSTPLEGGAPLPSLAAPPAAPRALRVLLRVWHAEAVGHRLGGWAARGDSCREPIGAAEVLNIPGIRSTFPPLSSTPLHSLHSSSLLSTPLHSSLTARRQLPSKDMGALGAVEGIMTRAALKAYLEIHSSLIPFTPLHSPPLPSTPLCSSPPFCIPLHSSGRQLPSKDLGAVGGMEGIEGRAAEKDPTPHRAHATETRFSVTRCSDKTRYYNGRRVCLPHALPSPSHSPIHKLLPPFPPHPSHLSLLRLLNPLSSILTSRHISLPLLPILLRPCSVLVPSPPLCSLLVPSSALANTIDCCMAWHGTRCNATMAHQEEDLRALLRCLNDLPCCPSAHPPTYHLPCMHLQQRPSPQLHLNWQLRPSLLPHHWQRQCQCQQQQQHHHYCNPDVKQHQQLQCPPPPQQQCGMQMRHGRRRGMRETCILKSPSSPLSISRPLKFPLNIPPLCLPCAGPPPAAAVPAPANPGTAAAGVAAARDETAIATEQEASSGGRTEVGGGGLGKAGATGVAGVAGIAGAGGDAATLRHEDGSDTPVAREEAAEREVVGCLHGERMGSSGGDTKAGIGGESEGGGLGGRNQGTTGMLDGQNGLKGHAWAEGHGLSHGLTAAEGCDWTVMQQQLEQSGMLARPPTPQQLQDLIFMGPPVALPVMQHPCPSRVSSVWRFLPVARPERVAVSARRTPQVCGGFCPSRAPSTRRCSALLPVVPAARFLLPLLLHMQQFGGGERVLGGRRSGSGGWLHLQRPAALLRHQASSPPLRLYLPPPAAPTAAAVSARRLVRPARPRPPHHIAHLAPPPFSALSLLRVQQFGGRGRWCKGEVAPMAPPCFLCFTATPAAVGGGRSGGSGGSGGRSYCRCRSPSPLSPCCACNSGGVGLGWRV